MYVYTVITNPQFYFNNAKIPPMQKFLLVKYVKLNTLMK